MAVAWDPAVADDEEPLRWTDPFGDATEGFDGEGLLAGVNGWILPPDWPPDMLGALLGALLGA